jgi:hypothetical protein
MRKRYQPYIYLYLVKINRIKLFKQTKISNIRTLIIQNVQIEIFLICME